MKLDFFGVTDFAAAILWLIVIIALAHFKASKIKNPTEHKYNLYNFYFKLLFALFFAAFYVFYYGGGDTTAYWQGSTCLNNLFFKSPNAFINELLLAAEQKDIARNFDLSTGFPPGWIYRESEGWFVSKIGVFLSFITFKSYWAATIIVSYLLSTASWKVYLLVKSYKIHKEFHVAVGVLFIPSVAFWCGGISKDALVLISIFYLIHHMFRILSVVKKSSWKNWIGVLICIFFIVNTRSVVLITVFAPLFFSYTIRLKKKYLENALLSYAMRFLVLSIGVGMLLFFIRTQGKILEQYIEEASVVQQDFQRNKTYGDKRYDLGISDYSPTGMLKAFPSAVIAGTFRPFIWESLSPTLILNGLESLFLMYLSLLFLFKGNIFIKLRQILSNEFLIFSLLFVLLMGFMAGFTGVLFGVLVRFKAPVLPFLVMLLTAQYPDQKKNDTEHEIIENGDSSDLLVVSENRS